jgi:4-amino-4-deoxy-L-arabinose transferase-like glycosyltransferase
MTNKSALTLFHVACILLLSYLFFFHALGDYSLKEPDEGRYAEIPREMVESGNYIVPYLNYARYFEKPPLLYWSVALSYRAFGISEWSFRFPNAMFAFLSVLALYLLGRRWFGPQSAFLSALMLISSMGFFSMARIVTTDMLLSFCLTVALLCFYGYYREKKSPFLYVFYAALALGTLTKGPIAILLMALSIVVWLGIEGRLSFLKELKWARGIALFLVLTAPWFIAVSVMEKQFFYFFFVDQHFLRFLTSKHKRTGPIYYFVPVLFGGLFPWSILLPRAVGRFFALKEVRLFLIWSAVAFLFFSVSKSKLPPYILPIFPALSLAVGHLFQTAWRARAEQWKENMLFIPVFLAISCLAGLHAAGFLDSRIPSSYAIAPALPYLRPFAIIIGIAALLAAVLIVVRKLRSTSVFAVLLGFQCVLILALVLNIKAIDPINTTRQLAETINRLAQKNDVIVTYGSFEETLPFYTRRPVVLAAYTGELKMGSEYPDAAGRFIDEKAFVGLFQSPQKVFCVLKTKKLARLRQLGLEPVVLGHEGEKSLICNRS